MTWDAVPLTSWQGQVLAAVLPPAVTVTDVCHALGFDPPPAPSSTLVVTVDTACSAGCCLVTRDAKLPAPRNLVDGQWIRPMFEVILDAGEIGGNVDPNRAMRIAADEYDRADRIFL